MIGEAIARNTEFGILLAGDKGVASVGCTAVVDKVTEKYPDGRMDIIVVGRRRFELVELDDRQPVLRGLVEFFDDEPDDEAADELRLQVVDLYQQILQLGSTSSLLDPDLTGEQTSYQVGQVITDLNERQILLMSKSEKRRLEQLADYLPGLLRDRKNAARARQAASTNGHGKRPTGLA